MAEEEKENKETNEKSTCDGCYFYEGSFLMKSATSGTTFMVFYCTKHTWCRLNCKDYSKHKPADPYASKRGRCKDGKCRMKD